MPTPIETAHEKYSKLNAEVFAALTALGISDKALLQVLRVSAPAKVKAATKTVKAKP